MEASDRDSALCPKCKTKLLVRESHRNEDGDVSYWNVECLSCGLTGKVWND
jgi:ssDNA-binding Zn-finger/Zn-ribbon topoisomerase 1